MAAGSGAIALAAALVACGGSGSSPSVLPPLSTTPTASAATAPPADPKAAAVAVVKEYFRLINGLARNMDYRSLAALMTDGCSCQEQVRAVKAATERGEHYVDQWRHLNLAPVVNSPRSVDVLAQYDTAAGGLVDKQGHRITSAPPQKNVKRVFHLERQGDVWLIFGISAA